MFILREHKTFEELIADVMKQMKITSDRTARRKTGVTLLVLKHWRAWETTSFNEVIVCFQCWTCKDHRTHTTGSPGHSL